MADNNAGNVRSQGWTQAFAEKSEASFAENFAAGVTLEASVLTRPIEGRDRVKTVMSAASKLYEELKFTQDTAYGPRTYLEWDAKAFGGQIFFGVTVITKDAKKLNCQNSHSSSSDRCGAPLFRGVAQEARRDNRVRLFP
jgi:hypothetical protein